MQNVAMRKTSANLARSHVVVLGRSVAAWKHRQKCCVCGRAEMECDGTRKRTGGEVKGKKANGGGSQQSCTVSDKVYPALLPLMRTPRLPAADINGLVRVAGKPNLVSARVPSHSVSALPLPHPYLRPVSLSGYAAKLTRPLTLSRKQAKGILFLVCLLPYCLHFQNV